MFMRTVVLMDVHDKYKKLTPREHVLMRPEMYIGAVVSESVPSWIEAADGTIKRQDVEYSQGMMKVIDEILVNASDNVLEHAGSKHSVTYVHITADLATGKFTIENDGPGIPVVKHKEHGIWIPEMVFGHLLTGKNFGNAENENNVSAGRHGYGAKLTNIFSKRFAVSTRTEGQVFSMAWSDNMAKAEAPKVFADKGHDFTRVEFEPDYEKLGMGKGLSRAFISALRKRCADLAVCMPDVQFNFNGKQLTSDFAKYINMYCPTSSVVVHSTKLRRDQVVGVAYFETPNTAFKGSHVSMVNGVVTYQGGTHLELAKSLVESCAMEVASKLGGEAKEFNKAKFFNHVIVFTSVYVSQPKFDSQSKVRLVSQHPWATFDKAPITEFLSKIPTFAEKFLTSVFKNATKPKKNSIDVRNKVQKVHDAVLAGKQKDPCTLLVTEGDSAAALAVGSLSVEQRRVFGVFPVRGKVMNVLTDIRRVAENKEWMDLFAVMGLDPKNPAADVSSLRYQRIVFMTDQDHDGTHIRGLLLSGLQRLFPQLTKTPGFANIFVTPMVKAFPAKGDEVWFESSHAFEEWKKLNMNTPTLKPARYYKGLGTSTTDEGKVYFSRLKDLIRPIIFSDEGETALIDSFHPDKVEHRRGWLSAGRMQPGDMDFPTVPLPASLKNAPLVKGFELPTTIVPLKTFVDVDLLQFALYDNSRMVPSMVDGLKVSGRKIVDGAMQHQKASMRVSQLAGLISQKMAYHHGEASLIGTIIGFAQDYVTANNIPLFTAEGQFGSRLVPGGKDHAAARYIFTQLRPIAWKIFPKEDLHLLDRTKDDGDLVEPLHFAPVIPMVFVNGSLGITVGHKVEIHPRDPLHVIAATRQLVKAKGDVKKAVIDNTTVKRFVTGFLGTIEESPKEIKSAVFHGAYEIIPTQHADLVQLRVVELPLNVSAEKYRAQLATMQQAGTIAGYFDYSTTEAIDFDVVVKKAEFDRWQSLPTGVHGALKLSKPVHENIIVFGSDGRLVDGATMADVFVEHYGVRYKAYQARIKEQLAVKARLRDIATGILTFVTMIHKGDIKMDTLIDQPKLEAVLKSNKIPLVDGNYSYITRMSIGRIFKAEIAQLTLEATNAKNAHDELARTTPEDLWLRELDVLEKSVRAHVDESRSIVVAKLGKRRKLGALTPPPLGVNFKASTELKGNDLGPDDSGAGGDNGGDAPAPPPPSPPPVPTPPPPPLPPRRGKRKSAVLSPVTSMCAGATFLYSHPRLTAMPQSTPAFRLTAPKLVRSVAAALRR